MLIALSSGEPAGVGPDIVLQLAGRSPAPILALGDYQVLSQRRRQLKLEVDLWRYRPGDAVEQSANALAVLDIPVREQVRAGQPQPLNADSVREQIRAATEMCLNKRCQAMVTAPVCKATLSAPGRVFHGQTEMIAGLCRSSAVMMLAAGEALRVALVTTHLPLREVAAAVTEEKIERTVRTVGACYALLSGRAAAAHCGMRVKSARWGARPLRARRARHY